MTFWGRKRRRDWENINDWEQLKKETKKAGDYRLFY
ncbi:hypothetical protein B14911_06396 [Bacillus sp. NRRL B-14911]|uniref:Uncharacterized protein n=1 Tax=Bacillus infantis NRRL B-14911 TaxID=1367477 RepID=U5LGI8_9BACI|nr:hypothetical protein N288_19020 [Bacillus infantis NRRL B-14911]EAR65500.1 hypothetical protein B14911_06396 [Bacillus sp. NRRL B-14911]